MGVGISDGTSFKDVDEWMAHSTSGVPVENASVTQGLRRIPIVKDPDAGLGTRDNNVISPMEIMPGGVENNVVDPRTLLSNKDLDKWELEPSTGIGLNIGLKGSSTDSTRPLQAPTEPAGALKPEGGSQVPGNGEKAENVSSADQIDWSRLNEPLGTLKGTAPEDTPIVHKSLVSPLLDIREGEIDRAINVGLSAGPGTMAGVKAATMGKKAGDLIQAHILEGDGAHPDKILKETGFFRGVDGRWRHEIDDSKAVYHSKWAEGTGDRKISTTLADVLDHPELYKAYPQLKNLNVTFDPKGSGGGLHSVKGLQLSPKSNDLDTVIHEVQHAIQNIEGFVKGGAPGHAGETYTLKLASDARRQIYEPLRNLKNIEERWGLTEAMAAEKDRLMALGEKYLKYVHAGDREAFANYQRLAGEVEARNVETRLLLTAAERRRLHPRWTEDYSPDKQFQFDRTVATDPYMGRGLKEGTPRSVTNLRRGANDNLPEGHPDRPYNVRDPSMIGSAEADKAADTAWSRMVERSKKIEEVNNKIDKLMKKYPHSEIDKERLKRLRQERNDIWK